MQPFALHIARTLACFSRLGEPDKVQNDLRKRVRATLRARGSWLCVLVLNAVLLAIRPDVVIPVVAFVPPVLHDIDAPSAVSLKRLEDADVVCVADADFAHNARLLEPDQRAPRGEGLRERAQGGV